MPIILQTEVTPKHLFKRGKSGRALLRVKNAASGGVQEESAPTLLTCDDNVSRMNDSYELPK